MLYCTKSDRVEGRFLCFLFIHQQSDEMKYSFPHPPCKYKSGDDDGIGKFVFFLLLKHCLHSISAVSTEAKAIH